MYNGSSIGDWHTFFQGGKIMLKQLRTQRAQSVMDYFYVIAFVSILIVMAFNISKGGLFSGISGSYSGINNALDKMNNASLNQPM
jgi:hypothetical protein